MVWRRRKSKLQFRPFQTTRRSCKRYALTVEGRATELYTDFDQQKSVLSALDEWECVIAPLIFTALAFFTRMYRIGLSNIVTWDEAQ